MGILKILMEKSQFLIRYLDIHGLDKGYLLVFNFNKNKEFKEEVININRKEIFQVYVLLCLILKICK